jgi:glutamate synthase (NADPH/NADH) small chain
MFEVEELPVTKWGTVRVGFNTMMTSLEGVFAAGDIVRGASLVVWGIRDGRDVANSIHDYIEEKNNAKNLNTKAS